MKNTAQTTPVAFTFSPSFSVRVVTRDDEPWFVAKDVAEALDYIWKGSSTVGHVPDKWRGVYSVQTPSGMQDMLVISEQGLYFFLGRSDKPKALPFQKWLAGEVLPAIRKTGTYSIQPAQPAPQPTAHLFLTVAELAQIKQAASGVSRYFRFHLSGGISHAIYSPIHSAYNIERIQDIPADKLAEVLATLKDMEDLAHAYYMEASRNEREIMKTLGQKRIAT